MSIAAPAFETRVRPQPPAVVQAGRTRLVTQHDPVHDAILWRCHTRVEKFKGEWSARRIKEYMEQFDEDMILAGLATELYERVEHEGNLLMTAGATNLWNGLTTAGLAAPYNNTNAALGVGDSSTAAAVGQTNLQGAVNVTDRVRKPMNASFPSVTTNQVQFQATFGTGDANFNWQEWGTFNNVTDASGTMLNRVAGASLLGTKSSSATWQLTVTLSLA